MTTTPETPPGATLHLGGQAWASPSLEPLLIPADQVLPYPGNPRRHDQDNITGSMRDLGCWAGVVTQTSTGYTLVGNGRRQALLDLGATYIPRTLMDVDDARAAAIVARDNQTSDASGNDDAALLALLAPLASDADLLALSGYGMDDLTVLRSLVDPPPDLYTPTGPTPSLADRFVVPPFTVLDQRSGSWQDRKRRWLALGIQSEVGRGHDGKGGHMGNGPDGVSLRQDPNQYAKREKAKRKTLGATQTNLDGEDAARYGRRDTRTGARTIKGQEGLTRIKPGLAGALAGDRSLAQGLQAHRDPTTGELTYTETTAAGVSIFDPVLTELAYRWFSPPGGHVLDPFAGGSVRGIVASALGRPYTGVELRPEQVAANQAQADTIVPRLGGPAPTPAPVGDYTPDLTPVETHGGHLVKRDDLYRRAGQRGGKVRTCHHLATSAATPGLVTASSRQSPQAIIVANIAADLGLPCRLHMPAGQDTPEMRACRAAGAEIVQHKGADPSSADLRRLPSPRGPPAPRGPRARPS